MHVGTAQPAGAHLDDDESSLRIREAGAGRLDTFLREVAKGRPAAGKSAKVLLGHLWIGVPRSSSRPPCC